MGWCHEFGAQVRDGCDHAMVAGSASCHCPECGFECSGKFAGCSVVWAAGPRDAAPRRREDRPAGRRSTLAGEAGEAAGTADEAEGAGAALGPGARRSLSAVGRRGQPDRAGRRALRPDAPPAGPWAGPAADAEMDLEMTRSGPAPLDPLAGAQLPGLDTDGLDRPATTVRRAGIAAPAPMRLPGQVIRDSNAPLAPEPGAPSPGRVGRTDAEICATTEPDSAPVVEAGEPPPVRATANGDAAQPAEDARKEVLDWLRVAFDGVRLDLRALREAMGGSQAEIAAIKEAGRAATRLVELVDELPERVGDAVGEVLRSEHERLLIALVEPRTGVAVEPPAPMAAGGRGMLPVGSAYTPPQGVIADRPQTAERAAPSALPATVMTENLREALSEVHAAASDLRNEMTRLAAFREALADDLPSVADAVDRASERANGRLQDLTRRVETLAEQPGWELAIEQLRQKLPDLTSGVAGIEGPRAS